MAVAVEKRIPLVLAGYSPGQPEPDRMVVRIPGADDSWPAIGRRPRCARAGCSRRRAETVLEPFRYPPGTCFPRYLAPFHAWPYNQAEIMKKWCSWDWRAIAGMRVLSTATARSTGFSMYSDLQNLHYNPYAPEFPTLDSRGEGRAEHIGAWQSPSSTP